MVAYVVTLNAGWIEGDAAKVTPEVTVLGVRLAFAPLTSSRARGSILVEASHREG
jgi:hypothetical protein